MQAQGARGAVAAASQACTRSPLLQRRAGRAFGGQRFSSPFVIPDSPTSARHLPQHVLGDLQRLGDVRLRVGGADVVALEVQRELERAAPRRLDQYVHRSVSAGDG